MTLTLLSQAFTELNEADYKQYTVQWRHLSSAHTLNFKLLAEMILSDIKINTKINTSVTYTFKTLKQIKKFSFWDESDIHINKQKSINKK